MTLFDYVRRHARALLFTVVVLVAAGAAAVFRMPVSLFPDVTFPRIVILADNGEQPAERMMVEVTKPLEEVASSVPGVNIVRSITSRGSTEISLGLDWGADVQQALQLLQGRIANIRNSLPPAAAIQAEQMTVSVFPILGLQPHVRFRRAWSELRDIALYQIRPALLRVQGVARVEVTGGDTREFRVTVAPAKLAAYHLDIRQVSRRDQQGRTQVGSAGLVYNNYQMYLSLVSGLLHTADDIRLTRRRRRRTGSRSGWATWRRSPPRSPTGSSGRPPTGREAVLINVLKQPTGSTVQIGAGCRCREVARRCRFRAGVRFENFYDQGDFIRARSGARATASSSASSWPWWCSSSSSGAGAMTLVIALVVPATIASTLLCLIAVGLTINIMTLGGIAAAVGLIIDDAIVVIENVFTRLAARRRAGRGRAAAGAPAIAESAARADARRSSARPQARS